MLRAVPTLVHARCAQSGSQLATLRQELAMLRQIAQMPEADRRAAAARPSPAGPSPAIDGTPAVPDALRELVAAHDALRGGREAARQAVFRPSHNLPTRSLAEQVCCRARSSCPVSCAARNTLRSLP